MRGFKPEEAAIPVALFSLAALAACITGHVTLCKAATYTGGAGSVLLVLAVLICKAPERWIAPGAALLGSATLVAIIKVLVGAPRPPPEGWLVGAEGPSFPSGHAAATAAFWTLVYLEYRSPALGIAGAIHTLAVSASRVALGVHYPVDVAGGVVIGSISAALLHGASKRRLRLILATSLASSTLLAIASPGYKTPWLLAAVALALCLLATYRVGCRGATTPRGLK
ncbi:MAG: phosphatase PAP2 family protein [Desulfurococcales archaeon]|nr:phosphatase PAP2 family protein [Desulfurococcales archaeon]